MKPDRDPVWSSKRRRPRGCAERSERFAAALADVRFGVADLPGSELGYAQGGSILIDRDGAGMGWSSGTYDLVSVVSHELGHVRNRDTLIQTITATVAGAIGMIANFAMFAGMFGGRDSDRAFTTTG